MTPFPIRLMLIVLALPLASTAFGQPGDWYVAPSVLWHDDDGDRNIDDSFSGIQVVAGRDFTDHITFEGLLSYSSIKGWRGPPVYDLWPNQTHIELTANLVAYYKRESTFAPYILLGVGYLAVDAETGSEFLGNTGRDNRPTASYGIGLKWRMGQSKYSIRTDYRSRIAFGDPKNLDDRIVSIGVQYDFGARKADPGIPPTNNYVDTDTDRDDDADGDGIFDSVDECPNTLMGAPVDRRGCSLDSDMDGVTTDKDRCPGTRAGAEVNIYGCDNDDDEDGVPNHRDRCPDTKTGVRIDINGCEIRQIISLPGVNFETGFDVLVPGTEYILQQAADSLNLHPDLHIEVAGHSDDVGNAAANAGLSERRAKTVRDYLIQYGVAEDRLTFKGYGESQPIADNSTEEGKATNRRVELRLVEQ